MEEKGRSMWNWKWDQEIEWRNKDGEIEKLDGKRKKEEEEE